MQLEEGREKGVVPRDDLQSFPDRPLFEVCKSSSYYSFPDNACGTRKKKARDFFSECNSKRQVPLSLRIVVLQKKLSKWRRKLICVCVSVCVFTSLLPGVADIEGKQGQERCRVQ